MKTEGFSLFLCNQNITLNYSGLPWIKETHQISLKKNPGLKTVFISLLLDQNLKEC